MSRIHLIHTQMSSIEVKKTAFKYAIPPQTLIETIPIKHIDIFIAILHKKYNYQMK